MKCAHLHPFDSTCEKAGRVCPGTCQDYAPARKFKAFGWEVTVAFLDGHQERFHWRGITEGGARRKGMLKTLATRIILVNPISEDQWQNAFGIGRM